MYIKERGIGNTFEKYNQGYNLAGWRYSGHIHGGMDCRRRIKVGRSDWNTRYRN